VSYEAVVTALREERAGLVDRVTRIDRALEALGGPDGPAVPASAPVGACPGAKRVTARRVKAVPTPHDKAIARQLPRRPATTASGAPARGAVAELRARLEALVIAAGTAGTRAQDVATRCHVSRITVLRQLRHLEAAGAIHMTGWSRSARWFAGKKARGL